MLAPSDSSATRVVPGGGLAASASHREDHTHEWERRRNRVAVRRLDEGHRSAIDYLKCKTVVDIAHAHDTRHTHMTRHVNPRGVRLIVSTRASHLISSSLELTTNQDP